MESKICRVCDIEKPINNFGIARKNKDGFNDFCKECKNEKSRLFYQNNKEFILEKYRIDNAKIETKIKHSKYHKAHREKNIKLIRIKALEKQKIKRKDPMCKFKESVRNRIRNSIKHNGLQKNSKTSEILGCSFDEFRLYLESKFESWMNWENRGLYNGELNYGWDIDHIIPQSYGNTEDELLKLNPLH
jgi:hypothetical protein